MNLKRHLTSSVKPGDLGQFFTSEFLIHKKDTRKY